MSNRESGSSGTLKTLVTASKVIHGLVELDGAGVTELATHLDLSKSTVYSYLQTLEELELIRKIDVEYQLSYQFLLLGEYVRTSSLLFQVGHEEIDALANDLGQYAHLVVEENGRGIILHSAKGENAVEYEYQRTKLHQRDPLHVTASGKAILASLPESRVAEIIDRHGLPKSTKYTITETSELYDELEEIRNRGYACNDQEEIEGFRAIAAPICTTGDEVLGSVTVSGPTSVFDDEMFTETLPAKVTNTANNIEVFINMMNKQHATPQR